MKRLSSRDVMLHEATRQFPKVKPVFSRSSKRKLLLQVENSGGKKKKDKAVRTWRETLKDWLYTLN